mmetsp:Transcript_21434/g.31869  ORF Transcript_21434/g.31869 Transcript_21434/m.31869 type:complete len:301 (+) Transcript_21434:68-970(+)|eukprot:CAMPEP_0167751944 /NCGR_PEP_ID=MMETSP0110_2-20121227/6857_1 /TAXON_ID=629695 /ORGANISM="Gymnochlora sp., Strain CCMP2014" /LENGTH=300 /DNA_ID=CAMNT_0007637491 /DNA_START=56 /DNA_END=958 /DNA_ORIENTATION=-
MDTKGESKDNQVELADISTKRKFVKDGVFFAELDEFLTRELGEDGYSGVEVRGPVNRTEIIIKATRTQHVIGEKGRRIRELTSLIQKRFNMAPGTVALYAEKVKNRGLCAVAQAESLCFRLMEGIAVRRACYSVLRYVMESEAKGCEIIISGKLRAQRAKSMKFKDGYMITSGDAANHYIDEAVRHIKLKQGVLGIKVKIMLPYDAKGKEGCSVVQPDVVTVLEPKEEKELDIPPKTGYAVDMTGGASTQPTATTEPQTMPPTEAMAPAPMASMAPPMGGAPASMPPSAMAQGGLVGADM